MHVDDSKITVREYLIEYLETHAKPNFKPTSYDTERTIIEARIIPVLGKIRLQALTPRAIKAFYAELIKKYSKEYVKNIHGVLKRALRLAYSESGLLAEDVMSKVSMRSKVGSYEQKEMKHWSMEEFTQFLESSKDHVHYIVFFDRLHWHAPRRDTRITLG
ncbi:N-terminal phage integrase SAM-like domain-containing protein [Paenibacillus sp. IHBB 10380]|uniref:N-terminal phage integrase SAM-like domain-containing protein n=1 Tax=Paenibacillus sp. IHBB 10380 TaxID=1566358 RepID=UPI000ADB890E|nr:N-terminal phage integrase SAM-like domain-containing protein [Paenibacillus sp. IHBB 10380]